MKWVAALLMVGFIPGAAGFANAASQDPLLSHIVFYVG